MYKSKHEYIGIPVSVKQKDGSVKTAFYKNGLLAYPKESICKKVISFNLNFSNFIYN